MAAALALVGGWLDFKYLSGINFGMDPPCSTETHLALVGIGAATSVVAACSLLLGSAFVTRHDDRGLGRVGVAWILSGAVIIGVVSYGAYLVTATQTGVLVSAGCHL